MKQWHMVIDVALCEDCNNCMLSCKDEHVGNNWPGYTGPQALHGMRWMNVERRERGGFPLIDVVYRPTPCMHCEDAPCVEAGAGMIRRHEDGVVLIDAEAARGRGELLQSCPYGAMHWNEAENVAQKCTLCAHLLAQGWKEPRCVQACPTGALRMLHVEAAEMERIAAAEKLGQLHPEYGTRPTVYYAHLERYERCFIAGSVAVRNGDTVDCAAGVRVTLTRKGGQPTSCLTDAFGDFRFDGLEANSGAYAVVVEMEGRTAQSFAVSQLRESRNIGVLQL